WDYAGDFATKCNMGMVELDPVDEEEDIAELRELIELQHKYTNSAVANEVLDGWPEILKQFVKVMPTDYKRVLQERKRHDEEMEATIHEDQSNAFSSEEGTNG
ncbi:MAG: hypothetical protein P8R04_04490, partial [Gammaproteobacteria bacterium]|nr:hypothetical protein [Gammaproteobacteria bacterium]